MKFRKLIAKEFPISLSKASHKGASSDQKYSTFSSMNCLLLSASSVLQVTIQMTTPSAMSILTITWFDHNLMQANPEQFHFWSLAPFKGGQRLINMFWICQASNSTV